ncbi:MAG: sulfate ABC transporter permease subunit CysT, partial [bacterium]
MFSAHGLLPRSNQPARVLPGFSLALGFTVFYLSLVVLIPLSALLLNT